MSSALSLRQFIGRVSTGHGKSARGPTPSVSMLEFGAFSIDLARRTATLRGQTLDLTPEELDVLIFLAGHPQSMITPHTMLSTKTNQLHQTEFLKTLLSLRAKIDAAAGPGTHYLRTESWVVYRFDPTPTAT